MPLITEDGTGLPNADSLASVEFADAYHLSRGNSTWQPISLGRKEQLLRQATDYFKYIFGPSLIGTRVLVTQSLPFPRIIDYINVGNPVAVQEAIAELALIANTSPLMPTENTLRKKMVKVGPITVEYDANGFTGPNFTRVIARFAPYLSGRSNAMSGRLVRT